ncbi:hypothetical protein PS720_05906 [Pseudomonas fluorescens]|nr:hypothetical protein PS720_05906 [Pseudomonas fluorescens]
MARGGGPPHPCRITGTPSVSEVPSVGARAFCLLLRFSKVSRCKSGTHSGRYLNNGYVPGLILHPGQLSGRQREQAPSPQVLRHTQSGVDTDAPMALNQSPDESTDTPLSGASPLPHLDRGLTVRWRSSARPPREQAPSPQVLRHSQNCVDTESPMALNQSPDESTDTPLSGASPLPHLDRSLTIRWWSAVRPPAGASSLATGPAPYPEWCRYRCLDGAESVT